MVYEVEILRKWHTLDQVEDINCASLSDFREVGTPNFEIQVEIKALTQVSLEIEDRGIALDPQVDLKKRNQGEIKLSNRGIRSRSRRIV